MEVGHFVFSPGMTCPPRVDWFKVQVHLSSTLKANAGTDMGFHSRAAPPLCPSQGPK